MEKGVSHPRYIWGRVFEGTLWVAVVTDTFFGEYFKIYNYFTIVLSGVTDTFSLCHVTIYYCFMEENND